MAWCFLGKIGDHKRRNLRYILILRVAGLPLWLSLWGGGRVPWVQVVQGAGAFGGLSWWCFIVSTGAGVPASGPEGGWPWFSGGVFPAFCPLYCFACLGLLANMALFRVLRGFLGGFMGFVLSWCFAWLVGLLYACKVRRFRGLKRVCLYFIRFSSSLTCFCPFACSFISSLLLSSGCPLSCFVCSCVLVGFCIFFFPCGLYTKRKGAPCWCVLSRPVVGCFIWLRLCTLRTRPDSIR